MDDAAEVKAVARAAAAVVGTCGSVVVVGVVVPDADTDIARIEVGHVVDVGVLVVVAVLVVAAGLVVVVAVLVVVVVVVVVAVVAAAAVAVVV